MDELRSMYIRLCQEKGSEPQEALLRELQEHTEASAQVRLDLSAQTLSMESCQVLGLLLENDVTFTHVLLSDCMLNGEGAKLILQGLRSNSVVKSLDLKGNNLRGDSIEALGKLLRQNSSLTSLILEWNNLGMWEEGFSMFCDGLGCNQTLQKLDLRNNQINHKGGEELSMALKRNGTLQELDLRWNNIGLLGGRNILNCLQNNRSIVKMELSGNNIPSDILRAIEQSVDHNQDRQMVRKDHVDQRQVLTKEVQNLKQEKNKQFLELMGTLDKQKEEMNRTSRTTTLHLGKLQEALEDRKSVVNSLTAKLHMADTGLALSQQKAQDLELILTQTKRDNSSLREQLAKDLRKEKEDFVARELKLRQELAASNEKILIYRSKAEELERKCSGQQEQLFELKQELTNTSAELKLRAMQAEERLEAEKKRFRQAQDDASVLRQKEMDHMTRHLEDSERAAQERVQRIEATKLALEEELSRTKITLANERAQAEEEIQKARNATQQEEQQHSTVLQDKIRTLTQSRDQAQAQVLQQKQLAGELQAQNNQLGLQIEGLKRRIDGLQQEISKKDQEKFTEVTKVRVELQEQIGHLEAELATQEGLKEKISALERQQKAQANTHRETLLDKESEISSLMEKLRHKEAEILRMRDQEAQRASLLQSAVLNYVSTPLGSPGGRT
ncbi:PREDICTED: leucine-rich repeat-containing protein 45 isoform X1 [Nanorana parkeri]|uniref:leucine-rich repeat-containing protein 45 isoform X1 n=1 Tax=Nanorana parkeri TaxID=125878 RepID=UPI000854FE8B|nr:PREDICTED: leucine-rich repeat-containing protein 45 isoform X1 [Nanorana parkeri]